MENLFIKLNSIIDDYDNFIIIGHHSPDLDLLGASLGLYEIIQYFNKNAYIFLDYNNLDEYNHNIIQSIQKISKNINFVNETNIKKIKGKNLCIIIDVHTKNRLEYPEIVDMMDIIILDHHIKNNNYIKDTRFTFIDSNLSSMSELITYYCEYLNIVLNDVIATILLGGIEIDTNGFNLKTTNKTYEAASILMEMGADSILKQELLKESKEDYMKRANFIKNSFMITDSIAMCIVNKLSNNIELAEIAEELLTFQDVEASYVIGKLDKDMIGVSARSLGQIDVSKVMTEMGGGGHSSNAATQILGKSIKEVKQDILNIIQKG